MISFFRKIRQNLLSEGKTTRYFKYAIGEIVLVVIGILIALQVNNYNNQRIDQQKANLLIKRLIKNLQNDNEIMKTIVDYNKVVINYGITAIKALNGVSSVSDEQFVIAAYQTSQINPAVSSQSAYSELKSTGKIDLIKNDGLKDMILGYYYQDWSQTPLQIAIAPYREYIRELIPYKIQQAIRDECGDIPTEVAQSFGAKLPENCNLELPDKLFSETAKYLRAQPEILKKLQFQMAVNDMKIFDVVNFQKENQKLLAKIKEHQL